MFVSATVPLLCLFYEFIAAKKREILLRMTKIMPRMQPHKLVVQISENWNSFDVVPMLYPAF